MPESRTEFESPRLIYEPLRLDHAAVLFDVLGDPLVSQHLGTEPPASIEELENSFVPMIRGPLDPQSPVRYRNFAVRLKSDGQWIGRIEASIHADWAELGYLLGPRHWGQGFASESLSWLHNHLRCEYAIFEFWACVAPANERSIRVLLRAGYQRTQVCDKRPLGSYDPGDEVFRHEVGRVCGSTAEA